MLGRTRMHVPHLATTELLRENAHDGNERCGAVDTRWKSSYSYFPFD